MFSSDETLYPHTTCTSTTTGLGHTQEVQTVIKAVILLCDEEKSMKEKKSSVLTSVVPTESELRLGQPKLETVFVPSRTPVL
jgi:hypothetical protein